VGRPLSQVANLSLSVFMASEAKELGMLSGSSGQLDERRILWGMQHVDYHPFPLYGLNDKAN